MIEILRDDRAQRLSGALKLEERHWIVPDGDWIRALRKKCGRDDLFVYFHKDEGTFVVAQWAMDPSLTSEKWCFELDTMSTAPDRGGWISLRMMELRCRPQFEHIREMKEAAQGRQYNKQAGIAESREQRADASAHYRRKGMDDIARSVNSSNYIGDRQGGEKLEQTKDMLKRMASEKTYA